MLISILLGEKVPKIQCTYVSFPDTVYELLSLNSYRKIRRWKCKSLSPVCLCDPMDYSLPGSSVHGIPQARILEWVAIPFSRASSQLRNKPRSPSLQADSLPSEPPGKYHQKQDRRVICYLGHLKKVTPMVESCCCSVAKLCLTHCNRHGLQHTRRPCPSLSPRVCSNSCPLSWWCCLTISSSAAPFSFRLQSFPASGSLPMSWLFALC